MKPKSFRKANNHKTVAMARKANAAEAIGQLEKYQDNFIMTYGQFSLTDALIAIIDITGPADVTISTWTAADAHLERAAQLVESADILNFRMIVDASFETRQPKYTAHMRALFGDDCIRAIKTHAKFLVIRNEKWDIVVRTSMNLNGNPRLENIEISENKEFADFFTKIADEIFREVKPGLYKQRLPGLEGIDEMKTPYKLVKAEHIKRSSLNVPNTTHTLERANR